MDDNKFESYKKMIEDLFEKSEKILQNNQHERIDMTGDTNEICKRKALEEIEAVRLAFIGFQENIKDLALANFLDSQIDEFARYAVSLEEVIRDEIDADGLSSAAKEKYSVIKKLRAQIMSAIYETYVKDVE